MEDIKEKVAKIVKKIENDKDFADKFKKDPVKAVEDILGVDLPDDTINKVIDAVKARITVNTISNTANKIKDLLK